MSWIQENKFTAGVLGAAVIASGALFYVGYSARSEAKEIRLKTNSDVTKTNALKRKQPYPSGQNKQLVITKVENFTKDALAFQQSLVAFRPSELPNLSEGAFGAKVSDHGEKLKKYYKEKGVELRDGGKDVAFGLEAYSGGSMAKAEATRLLDYERKALEWLFTTLADAGPDSLDNVYRTPITEEVDKPVEKTSRKKKKKGSKKVASQETSVYRAMPIEVTFTGTEHTLKEFLKEINNAKDYFFITRSVRISNVKVDPPDVSEGEFKEAPVVVEGFGGDDFMDMEEVVEQPILKQVTGSEKIKVHLKLDLALFHEASEVVFPGAVKFTKKEKAGDAKAGATPKK